jgi:hypothetical protein
MMAIAAALAYLATWLGSTDYTLKRMPRLLSLPLMVIFQPFFCHCEGVDCHGLNASPLMTDCVNPGL